MQDYLISMPILDGGMLHKGSSFLLEAHWPSGHCIVHEGCRNCREKQEKLFPRCAGWKAALPSAAGMALEGSELLRTMRSARSSELSVLLHGSEPHL